MHAPLRGAHIVGKGDYGLAVAVVVLQGHLHGGVVLLTGHVDHVLVDRGLVGVKPGDVLPDPPLVAHGVGLIPPLPSVVSGDLQARVQKRLLLHPGVDDVVAVGGHVEHLRVRLEGDHGAGFLRRPHHPHGLGDLSPGELHLIDLAVLVDLDLQPLAQGVDHAGAHAVEAAGYLVAPAAELAAGVEYGVHHLQGGKPRLGLDIHRDAPAVVGDGDGVPGVDGDGDLIAVPRQSLVDGVMQARLAGGADIHARPLPYGLQPLQHLNFGGVVLIGRVHNSGI